MTIRYCKTCGDWHDLDKPWPRNCAAPAIMTRSDLPAPMLIIDTMEPVQSMLDGKMYDSKSELRRTYKHAGVTEVGNDPQRLKSTVREKSKPDRRKIKEAVQKAAARFNRGERASKTSPTP
jgi:hypothetical protein